MYIVEDTVERSIYDISVTRRLAHMDRGSGTVERSEDVSLENRIDEANTMELEQTPLGNVLAKGSSGGEVVGKEDVWNCLFQHRPGQIESSREAGQVVEQVGLAAGEVRLELEGPSTSSA